MSSIVLNGYISIWDFYILNNKNKINIIKIKLSICVLNINVYEVLNFNGFELLNVLIFN